MKLFGYAQISKSMSTFRVQEGKLEMLIEILTTLYAMYRSLKIDNSKIKVKEQ